MRSGTKRLGKINKKSPIEDIKKSNLNGAAMKQNLSNSQISIFFIFHHSNRAAVGRHERVTTVAMPVGSMLRLSSRSLPSYQRAVGRGRALAPLPYVGLGLNKRY